MANRNELKDMERIKRHLAFEDLPYRKQMLAKTAIRQLLNTLGYVDNADEFTGKLIEEQNEFLDWASKPNSLRRLNAKTVDFYKVVLEVALEDSVNASEFRLLERFRLKLGITRRGHRITEFQCIDNALVEPDFRRISLSITGIWSIPACLNYICAGR